MGSLNGGLHNLVLGGVDVDGAVTHSNALIAAHQNEAGADRLDAGLALDELQCGADSVSGGVGSAAQQAVGLAHLDQHGAEVVALGQGGTALLIGHLALAQLNHLSNHLIEALVVGRVDNLSTGDIKAALCCGLLDGLNLTQQDDLQRLTGQQAACSGQDAGIGTLGKDDRLRLSLQLFLKILENGHTLITSIIPAAHGCITLTLLL